MYICIISRNKYAENNARGWIYGDMAVERLGVGWNRPGGQRMVSLVKYELYKIGSRKTVWALLVFLAFFNAFTYWGLGPLRESVLTTEGEMLEGVEAVKYMQEFDRQYAGVLTDEKVREVYRYSYSPEVIEKAEGKFLHYSPDIIQYLDGAFSQGEKVEDVFTPEMGEIYFGYHRGNAMFLFYMMNVILTVGCVIVIAIAPVFAEEYSRGTDALVLTAKYGKTLAARSKVAAAFLFSFLLWMAVGGGNVALLLAVYGTEGWDVSVQVDFMKWNQSIPYEMNYAQLVGYALLIWLISCLLLTGMTLALSACCHTLFSAVVASIACYVTPVWFSLPECLKLVLPAYQAQPQRALNYGYLSVGGQKIMPYWMVVGVSVTLTFLFAVWAKRMFRRRQVM